ncbi:hypothetical protein DH2020_009180 [Rehmannia glutinosa]|uniref:Proline dehydrogenase n=1 Tax=Rehmannia glutinosa TaxID=99300 RepID=A0ABR0X8I5_REHGL
MVNRSVRPKNIRNLRRLNSAAPSAVPLAKLAAKPDPAKKKPVNPIIGPVIDLDDTKGLFSSFTFRKLIKSSVTLHVAAYGPMVDFGTQVMGSGLMRNPLFKKAVLGVTERTFYEHFCAGKNLEKARETVERLWDAGLYAMLDYGLEHAHDSESCDKNLEEFIHTINFARVLHGSPVSYVAVKITAICPPTLLRRISDLLRWEYKDNSLHLPWKRNTFPIFATSSPLYHTPQRPAPLTPDEERDLNSGYERLRKICENAIEANIPVLIDAEDTSIQPAIDYFTYSAAVEYSSSGDDDPVIFNTVQAYLKDAKDRLVIAKEAADSMGVPVGFKLVRGAYMSTENGWADLLGVKSPIHDSIQDTHDCYNECADFLIEEIASGSGKMAASKAVSLGIEKDSPYLQFAQLYGMAEALSFGLKNAGFRVSKYLPFGPVEHIMPYLLRRAEENRGLLSTSSLDRFLMRKELMRRLTCKGS